jgi:hypothetical protein
VSLQNPIVPVGDHWEFEIMWVIFYRSRSKNFN